MKKTWKTLFFINFLILVSVLSCKKNEYKNIDCRKINATFANDINPIIQGNCLSSGCHNSASNNGDFTSYAGIKGKANNGSLEKRVLTKKDMPTSGALSLDDRKKIKCWLSNGAPNN